MTSPRNASSTGAGQRFYSWRSEQYWSVTTLISGGLPKPFLLPWGIKMVAEGACDLADELPALVRKDRDSAIKMLKGLPYAKRDRAADLGSTVHAWIEADRLSKPLPPAPPGAKPYLAAFAGFIRDFGPTYEATEASVYNRSQAYAGTLDTIARLRLPLTTERRRFVVDVKTGKNIYPEVALQLSAYRHAEFIGLPDGSEAPMPPTDGALCLHLSPDGYRLIEVQADDAIFKAFLHVREVFRFTHETGKQVLGAEYRGAPEEETQAKVAAAIAIDIAPSSATLLDEVRAPGATQTDEIPF